MKPKFEIGDRVRIKDTDVTGEIINVAKFEGVYLVLLDEVHTSLSFPEHKLEFTNPKAAFLTRLQELLASFDAKICSCAEGCDTSWIDVYFGEQCVIAFPINRTTECTTITAENVFDYDKD